MQLRDRATALTARGHDVAVVSMLPFLDFEELLHDAGVATLCLGVTRPLGLPVGLARYTSFLRAFSPEVVHSHLFSSTMFARGTRLLPRALRGDWRVLVCSSHANHEVNAHRYAVYRWTNGLGDAWTSVTRSGIAVHEREGAVPVGAALWTPNGVVLDRYRPPSPSERVAAREEFALNASFTWLALGSFRDESKDYGTLLRALAVGGGDSLLLVGGEGALLEEKRALAESLGLTHRVRFLGLRSDVERLFHAADAYVLSSQTEAMPNVLLQAGACELPAVSTDVGEAAEIIEDGVGGIIVPARDSAALALALRKVQAMPPSERQTMGKAARERVAARFDMTRVIDRWEQLYRKLLDAREA